MNLVMTPALVARKFSHMPGVASFKPVVTVSTNKEIHAVPMRSRSVSFIERMADGRRFLACRLGPNSGNERMVAASGLIPLILALIASTLLTVVLPADLLIPADG